MSANTASRAAKLPWISLRIARFVTAPQQSFFEDAPRRRHWSDEDKIRVVEESHRGHRQVSATARRHGICRSLLTVWRRQYRDGELANASGSAFVPVKMAPDIDTQSPRRPAADVQLEILLRNGRRLLVPSSVDPDALARLLPTLEGK